MYATQPHNVATTTPYSYDCRSSQVYGPNNVGMILRNGLLHGPASSLLLGHMQCCCVGQSKRLTGTRLRALWQGCVYAGGALLMLVRSYHEPDELVVSV